MAVTNWIFDDTDERLEYQELTDGTRQSRTVQVFIRIQIYTNGSAPVTLNAGDTAASVSADNGAVTISSTGAYVCTQDGLRGQPNEPTGIMIRRQVWEEQGDWADV